MVAQAESSRSSVNERLARARQEDLRRCRNLQAKLRRAQMDDVHDPALGYETTTTTLKQRFTPVNAVATCSRTGLMFLSSTEQAQRERDQRSRERQLKRQVAGPIPPESWRDDFDRLSIRKGVANHLDRKQVHDLVSATSAAARKDREADKHSSQAALDPDRRRRIRASQAAICSGVRFFYDPKEHEGERRTVLGLRDMTLCVIADALNCPSRNKGQDHSTMPEMNPMQLREVLDYLPRHMQERMMALCGRLAATDWPLSEWTAQIQVDLDKQVHSDVNHSQVDRIPEEAQDDWETSSNSPSTHSSTLPTIPIDQSNTSLDLSFSTITTRTLNRLLSTLHHPHSLRMLSLAGTSSLDTPPMHAIFAQLSNLEILSLAGSRLSPWATEEDHQRAGVFLRKLSRSLVKLETLDLSHCGWVSADAIQAVSWATRVTVAWPRIMHLVLVGCRALVDPRMGADKAPSEFSGKAAGSWLAQWHARHSQRDVVRSTNSVHDGLYDTYTDIHRDPFDLFAPSTPATSQPTRATFSDYVNNDIQPAIISHMTWTTDDCSGSGSGGGGLLMEFVRCPRSAGKIEMWQWQRARIIEAVRGRSQPHSRQRQWIEVYF